MKISFFVCALHEQSTPACKLIEKSKNTNLF